MILILRSSEENIYVYVDTYLIHVMNSDKFMSFDFFNKAKMKFLLIKFV